MNHPSRTVFGRSHHRLSVAIMAAMLACCGTAPLTSVPPAQVLLGLVTTFILVWFAGVLIVGIYNLSLRVGK